MADEAGPILVVDQDDDGRSLMGSILEGAGFRTARVASGESALDVARSTAPRLALVDVFLPGLTGYETCHELKAELGQSFPVVLVSRTDRKAVDAVAAFLLKVDECVAKPLRSEDVLAGVQRLLARSSEAA